MASPEDALIYIANLEEALTWIMEDLEASAFQTRESRVSN